MSGEPSFAAMITTKDRADDLRRTIKVLKSLDPQPNEILITADGCTDDTIALVHAELPQARLFVNEPGKGSVASRDRMLRESTSDLVLSLDDDSYPEQRDCVSVLKSLFRQMPELALAHFPQRSDEYPETLAQADFGPARLTGSFANSGACYRREDYLHASGFPAEFFHAYEEPDFSLQLVAEGKLVLYFPGVTIRHHYSPVERSEIRTHQRHARNELWSSLLRCPFPLVLVMIPARILSQARYALSRGLFWALREPTWWWAALKGAPRMLALRHPVSQEAYRRWLRLMRTPVEFDFRANG